MKNVVITILAILLILTGGYIIYDKILSEKNQNQVIENETANDISKLDDTKEWVYDANYNLSTDKDSYYGHEDNSVLIKAEDLKVPYINIDSIDAKRVNQEIYKLYEDLINRFNENSKYEIYFTTVKYEVYDCDEVISVVITTESAGTGFPQYDYYTYNFSLKDGKLLSFKEIYKYAGYSEYDIDNRVEQAITSAMGNILGDYNGGYLPGTNFNTHVTESINNYKASITTNNIKYFIDANNKLNVYVYLAIDDIVDGDHEQAIIIQ